MFIIITPRLLVLLLFWCFCSSWLVPTTNAAYVVKVRPHEEECFVVRTTKTSTLSGSYDFLDDELVSDPLLILIVDTDTERILYKSRRGKVSGSFEVPVDKSKRLTVCLQNGLYHTTGAVGGRRVDRRKSRDRPHDGYDRTVGIDIRVEPRDEMVELQTHNEKLIAGARHLSTKLADLMNHHVYIRSREAKHRELVEQTFSQLFSWICLEALAVVLIALGQVIYLRRFLERRRYI